MYQLFKSVNIYMDIIQLLKSINDVLGVHMLIFKEVFKIFLCSRLLVCGLVFVSDLVFI